jgi:hypothetical protein
MKNFRFAFHDECGRVTEYRHFEGNTLKDAQLLADQYAASIHSHGVCLVNERGNQLPVSKTW